MKKFANGRQAIKKKSYLKRHKFWSRDKKLWSHCRKGIFNRFLFVIVNRRTLNSTKLTLSLLSLTLMFRHWNIWLFNWNLVTFRKGNQGTNFWKSTVRH